MQVCVDKCFRLCLSQEKSIDHLIAMERQGVVRLTAEARRTLDGLRSSAQSRAGRSDDASTPAPGGVNSNNNAPASDADTNSNNSRRPVISTQSGLSSRGTFDALSPRLSSSQNTQSSLGEDSTWRNPLVSGYSSSAK